MPPALRHLAVHGALAAAQCIFGGQSVIAKWSTQTIPGPLYALFRNVISLPVVLFLAGLEKPPPESTVEQLQGKLIVLGILAVGVSQPFIAIGVGHVGATGTAILTSLVPLYVAVISIGIGEDSFSLDLAGGLTCAFGGAIFSRMGGGHGALGKGAEAAVAGAGGNAALGTLLVVSGSFAYAVAVVMQKRVVTLLPPSFFLSRVYMYGAPLVALIALPTAWSWEPAAALREGALYGVLYGGLLTGVLGYSLVSRCARVVSPVVLSSYALLQPLVAALAAAVLLGEWPRGSTLAGGALVLAGLALVTRHNARHGHAADERAKAPTPPSSPHDLDVPHVSPRTAAGAHSRGAAGRAAGAALAASPPGMRSRSRSPSGPLAHSEAGV